MRVPDHTYNGTRPAGVTELFADGGIQTHFTLEFLKSACANFVAT